MSTYDYHDVFVKVVSSSDNMSLTDEFEHIDDIELNVSGSVVVYTIQGLALLPDGEDTTEVKKIVTISGNSVTHYYVIPTSDDLM